MLASYKVAKESGQFARLKPLSTQQKMDTIMMQLQCLITGGNAGTFQVFQSQQPVETISEEQERQEAVAILNEALPPEAQVPPSSLPTHQQNGSSKDAGDVEMGAEVEHPASPPHTQGASQAQQLLMTPSGTTHSRSELRRRAILSPNGSHYNVMYTLNSPNGALQSPQPMAQLPAPPSQPHQPLPVQHAPPGQVLRTSHQQMGTLPLTTIPTAHPHMQPLPQAFVPNAFTTLQPNISDNPEAAMAWAPMGHQDMMLAAQGGIYQRAPTLSDQLVQAVAQQMLTIISEQCRIVPHNAISPSATTNSAHLSEHVPQPLPQLGAAEPFSQGAHKEKPPCQTVPTLGVFSNTGVTGIYNWWTGKTINACINGKSPREHEEEDQSTAWRSGKNGKQKFSDLKKCIDAITRKAVAMANERQRPVTEEQAAVALDDELAAYRATGKKMSFYDYVKTYECQLPVDK